MYLGYSTDEIPHSRMAIYSLAMAIYRIYMASVEYVSLLTTLYHYSAIIPGMWSGLHNFFIISIHRQDQEEAQLLQ